jgi:tetratricopeptide (TPR) repeat protein
MNESPLAERLKRSALVQAVVVFLGASWVVLQVVDLLQERLGLPDWVFPFTLILLAVGFVVVLATAMVQSRASTTAAEEAGEVPSDWEVAPADALASLKAGRLPHLTWGRAVVGGVVSLSLLFGLAGAFVLVTGGGARLGPMEVGANEAATGLAILPFSANTDDLAEWEVGIVDLLAPGLDGVAGYRTIASRTVLAEWREQVGEGDVDLDAALAVAGSTGARYGMVGNVVALGGTVRLTAEVYDLADGSKVADGAAEGSEDEMLPLVEELGLDAIRDLMGAVGGEGVSQQLPARLTTTSLAAARAFLEGESHYRAGRFNEAVQAYEEAMEADSTFGLPVLRADLALGWVGTGEQQEGMGPRLEAALENLPSRDRILARLRLAIRGDSLKSAAPAEEAVVRYPDDAEAWFMLGEVRHHEPFVAGGGHGPAREAFEKALELDPGFVPYFYHAAEYALGAGDVERAEELIAAIEEAAPEDPRIEDYRQGVFLLTEDLDSARAVFLDGMARGGRIPLPPTLTPALVPRLWALIEGVPTGGDIARLNGASVFAMAAGKATAAREYMNQIPQGNSLRVTLARHHQDLIGPLPGFDAESEYVAERCAGIGSRLACREKVALHHVDMGRVDEALQMMADFDARAEEAETAGAAMLSRRMARTIEAYVAWKTGDTQGALRAFEEARSLDRFAVTVRWLMPEVLLEGGQATAAVSVLLSLDASPDWAPFGHLRAAEILEDMGDATRAAEYYRSALSAWIGADEGFEPKTRAQAGLARVEN